MQPIFKEKEENGIYTATLDGVTDNGVTLNETFEMNIKSMKDSETERCLKLGLSLSAIERQLQIFISNEKTYGIDTIYKRFNQKVGMVSMG